MGLFSKTNKILVYGSNGWIGSLFVKLLQDQGIKYHEGTSRVDQEKQIIHEINKIKPTHIIAFIGRTHGTVHGVSINTIDYLEYPGKLRENIRDNLFAPMILSSICAEKKIHYTYIGTGCIFNNLDKIYHEDDIPDFFGSSYSIVKGFTDRLIRTNNVLNIRIRMPISSVSNNRNFINKILSYKNICSMKNSMTVLDDYLPIILDLLLKKKTGTYNCTNPGTISHDEILCMYKDDHPDFTWKLMTLEEQKKYIKSERSNNELDVTKISNNYKVPDIHTSVKKILLGF